MKTPEQWMQESVWLHHEIAAIQSDAREGMVPVAELQAVEKERDLLIRMLDQVGYPETSRRQLRELLQKDAQ